MFDYLALIHAGIPEPSGCAFEDGVSLASQCLKKLSQAGNKASHKARFPPKLLILLASPAYLDQKRAEQLLTGVNETFGKSYKDVPLIGSSVGAVFFDQRIYSEGAVLICLASRLIESIVASGTNSRRDPPGAINQLLTELGLDQSEQIDPNPLANRLILTFMPGCNQAVNDGDGAYYPAPELHRLLYEGVQARISIVGGVSSANDPSRMLDGLQFLQGRVLRDAVVAASIVSGVPIGISLNDGLKRSDRTLRATSVGDDGRTILEFDGKKAQSQISAIGNDVMLAKLSAGDQRVVEIPLIGADGSINLLRPLSKNDYFAALKTGTPIIEQMREGIREARRRVFVEKPIATLLFPCKAYNLRHENGALNMEAALAQIESDLQRKCCVGGFFDGEIGIDRAGRSQLTNGAIAYVIFGDEMRERTPLYRGVSALAEYGPGLLVGYRHKSSTGYKRQLTHKSLDKVVHNALKIIDEAGFPGAMISLVMTNRNSKSIIALKAIGPRFKRIVRETRRSYRGRDILAIVARTNQPRFVRDSGKNPHCESSAVKRSALISQYVLPLRRLDKSVFGILQVDLGDLRHLSEKDFSKTEKARMLNCFAEVIGASINRLANAIENDIIFRLDRALNESLSSSSITEGLQKLLLAAGKALGVSMGQLRLVKLDSGERQKSTEETLVMEAGFGPSYEAGLKSRRAVRVSESSPICNAFRADRLILVNDVSRDSTFKRMLSGIPKDSELSASLGTIKSYAAVPFKNARNEKLGAVSVGSTETWFFFNFHRNALRAFAERAGFLVEHLRSRLRLKFLFNVSQKLAERNLDDAESVLAEVTKDFRKALNAKVASLYLWDQDREEYILRAQSGWASPEWVHAASYHKNAGWIGVKAINKEPLYEPDLYQYYGKQKGRHQQSGGRYAKYMFGRSLSSTFTAEAIGLPLRIGRKQRDKFGVLTLYRPIKKGQPSGFLTTDVRKLLREGTYSAAGLVSAVLRHRDKMWEKEEEHRRQQFYEAINSNKEEGALEKRICSEVLLAFHATSVEFYQVSRGGSSMKFALVAEAHRSPETRVTRGLRNEISDPLITQTLSSTKVAVSRKGAPPKHVANAVELRSVGLVEGACIPLIVGTEELLGVLRICWKVSAAQAFSLSARHDDDQLQALGQMIGAIYLRHRISKKREQSNLALQATAAYAVQRAHLLRNTIQELQNRSRDISKGRANVDVLAPHLKIAMRIVKETTVVGKRVLYPAYRRCLLSRILDEVLEEQGSFLKKRFVDLRIAYSLAIPNELAVRVDPSHTKDSLFNLLTNAVNAIDRKRALGRKQIKELGIKYSRFVPNDRMLVIDASTRKLLVELHNNGGEQALKGEFGRLLETPNVNIAVTSVDEEKTTLVISDNGIGMTEEEQHDALRGFVRARDHEGVGVLISYVLLTAQGGSLSFQSTKFLGTKTIMTLQSIEME